MKIRILSDAHYVPDAQFEPDDAVIRFYVTQGGLPDDTEIEVMSNTSISISVKQGVHVQGLTFFTPEDTPKS